MITSKVGHMPGLQTVLSMNLGIYEPKVQNIIYNKTDKYNVQYPLSELTNINQDL